MSEPANIMSTLLSEGVEGKAPFKYGNETFETWYKVFGELNSGVTPLVVLHGGPGVSHHYMLSITDLVKTHNIPVVIYDQIGTYNSYKPEWNLKEKPRSYWDPSLFMDELENLVSHLKISDNFSLLGQSWGGMLASNIAAQRQPKGLKKVVISNSPASLDLWMKNAERLLNELPKETRDTIKKHEAAGTIDSPEFLEAMGVFYLRHVCRIDPMPEPVAFSFAHLDKENWLYRIMNGPTEFMNSSGTLSTWNLIPDLHKINVPTLLINGEFDEAQDVVVQPFFDHIAKVKWVTLSDASHMSHWERREKYMQVAGGFLSV